jgi:hypothetical protein
MDGAMRICLIFFGKIAAWELMTVRSVARNQTGCVNSGRRWHRRIPFARWPIPRGQLPAFAATRPPAGKPFAAAPTTAAEARKEENMTSKPRFVRGVAASIVLATMLSGCALAVRRPSVAELKYNPGRYHDKTIAIDGVVTSSWGVPLVPFKLYKVSDGTGEVTVVAQNGRTPTKGAHVRVKGKVNDFATFGGQSLGLHIQQTDLDFKRR